MSKACEFLKACGYFYVLTINGDFPAGRPFGAVMEEDGRLYIATNPGNHAQQQLRENEHVQILAKKEGTREWLRITGKAHETQDLALKARMMEDCPNLQRHYASAEDPKLLVFGIDVLETEFH